MTSHYINGYGSTLVVQLEPHQILKEPNEIALRNFTTYNHINNLTIKNNTFRLLWYQYPPDKTANTAPTELTEQLKAKVKELEDKLKKSVDASETEQLKAKVKELEDKLKKSEENKTNNPPIVLYKDPPPLKLPSKPPPSKLPSKPPPSKLPSKPPPSKTEDPNSPEIEFVPMQQDEIFRDWAKIDIIEIPEGLYELDELIEEIKKNKRVQEAEVQFDILKNQKKIKINPKYAFLDFNVENSMNKILGYAKRTLSPNTFTISDYNVDIFSINCIKIKINVINYNYENGKFNDNCIYQFSLNTPTGEKIVIEPANPKYVPLNTDVIRELWIDIVDQDNKPINFGHVPVTMEFHIRKIK
jgi:hypothetical protein